MARLLTVGFEWNNIYADGVWSTPASQAASASAARSGDYGNDGADAGGNYAFATGTTYYFRAYVRKSGNPSGRTNVIYLPTATSLIDIAVWINTDGTVGMGYRNSPPGVTWTESIVSGSALGNDTWYRIECSVNIAATSGTDDALELKVDGSSIGTATVAFGTAAPNRVQFGASSTVIDTDDCAANDTTGSDQTTWPGEGKVLLLYPVSDNQDGTWVGAGGGTAAMYGAMDNRPPTGKINASATDADQNESQDSSGDNTTDELRVNLRDYTTAGIGASDTITLVHPLVCHGEQISTGSKTGKFGLVSNPANTNGGGETSFTYGNNAGAVDTYPTNWYNTLGTPVYSPSVTLGTSPVIAIRKTDTGTRWAVVCEIGAYVEYVPAAAPDNPRVIKTNTIQLLAQ